MILKYDKYINESVRDMMKPISEDDIKKHTKDLNPREKMAKAIEYDLLWLAQEAIDEGLDLQEDSAGGYSLGNHFVSDAVRKGCVDVFKLLLDNGVDMGDEVSWFLNLSVTGNNYEIAKLLVEMGGKFYSESESIVEIAVNNNNLEMLELILDSGSEDEGDKFDTDWFISILIKDNINPNIIRLMIKKIPECKDIIDKTIEKYRKGIEKLSRFL